MSSITYSSTNNVDGEPISNVVSKECLRQQQLKVINHLDKVVSCTYGPMASNTEIIKGNNDRSIHTEFSKDGHTVLKNVIYNDSISCSIAKEMEEITHYTESRVGDGTTTATKMSAAIFNRLCKYESESKISPYVLIRKFQNVVKLIQDEIIKHKQDITLDDIYNISLISTNGNTYVASLMEEVYKKFGMNVFVDVSTSNNENTYTKEYDGMVLEVGASDPAYYNSDKCIATLHNARVYAFQDPIDTPEMVNFMEAIINANIWEPLAAGELYDTELIPTVIIAPKISRDITGLMKKVVDYMNRFTGASISQKPPLLIITNIGPYAEDYSDIAELCGCKIIKKYIDFDIQKRDQESGLAPTLETITDWYGECELIVSDSVKTTFTNPKEMYIKEDGERKYSVTYTNLLAFLQAELDNAIKNNDNNVVTGRLKRRINSLKANLVEILVGGIEVADRDSLRTLVEDAVLNCRSASKNGVGYAANFEGLRASKASESLKLDSTEKKLLKIISESYEDVCEYLYGTLYEEDKAKEIVKKSLKEGKPYNISTESFDGKVLASIDTDICILDAISKIITIMFTANQALVQSPILNTYVLDNK